MARQKLHQTNIRKITKVGKQSLAVTIPIEMVRELKWKERQKVIVKRVKRGLLINDWRKR